MNTNVLFVDDDPSVLDAHQRNFRKRFQVETATGGDAALGLIASKGPYAVVVADMRMPRMNGVEFLLQAQEKAPDTVRIMLTGNSDHQTALDAVNKGHVYQFLCKPCPPDMLVMAIENGMRQYALVTAERELLEKTLAGSIRVMTEILALQDPESFQLGQKLRDRVRAFAESHDVSKSWELEMGAMLSPIGFVTVPGSVVHRLRSGASLTEAEEAMVRKVPEIGAELLAKIPRLESVARMILYQKKNYDGTGFPEDSVSGDDIPVGARLLRVVHDLLQLEAVGSSREEALRSLHQRNGAYDPAVLQSVSAACDVFLPALETVERSASPVLVRDLSVGRVLAADVETREGTLLVTRGTKVSPLLLEKLRNFAKSSGLREPLMVED